MPLLFPGIAWLPALIVTDGAVQSHTATRSGVGANFPTHLASKALQLVKKSRLQLVRLHGICQPREAISEGSSVSFAPIAMYSLSRERLAVVTGFLRSVGFRSPVSDVKWRSRAVRRPGTAACETERQR